ncbi:hypothetical protein DFH27DRAFT_524823 [Peziza echinospora]|nr:hypothetical protein DFH27DRAFT_524823 [Peziza echinospora]
MVDAAFQTTTRELDPSEIEDSPYLQSRNLSPDTQGALPARPTQSYQQRHKLSSRSRGREIEGSARPQFPSYPEPVERERGRSRWRLSSQNPQQKLASRSIGRRANSAMSSTVTERGTEHSRPRMQGALPEPDPPLIAGSETPVFVAKLQVAWSNCVKTVTSFPFRKSRQVAKNSPPAPAVDKPAKSQDDKNNASQNGRDWMTQLFGWYGKSGEKQISEKKRKEALKSGECDAKQYCSVAPCSENETQKKAADIPRSTSMQGVKGGMDGEHSKNSSPSNNLSSPPANRSDQMCASPSPLRGGQQQAIHNLIAHSSGQNCDEDKPAVSEATIEPSSSTCGTLNSTIQSSVSVIVSKEGVPDTLVSITASSAPGQEKHVHFRGDKPKQDSGDSRLDASIVITTRETCSPQTSDSTIGSPLGAICAEMAALSSEGKSEGMDPASLPAQGLEASMGLTKGDETEEDNWVGRWLASYSLQEKSAPAPSIPVQNQGEPAEEDNWSSPFKHFTTGTRLPNLRFGQCVSEIGS